MGKFKRCDDIVHNLYINIQISLFFVSDRNYVPFDICIVNCLHENRFSSFSNMFSSTRFVYTQSAIKFVVSEKITLILLFTRTFQKKTFVRETNN